MNMKNFTSVIISVWSFCASTMAISGGSNVSSLIYPYTLAIFHGQPKILEAREPAWYQCAASALNWDYIVTAGHCLTDGETSVPMNLDAHPMYAIGGTSYISEMNPEERQKSAKVQELLGFGSTVQRRKLIQSFVHLRYKANQKNDPHDIGVAKLESAFAIQKNGITPIPVFSHVFSRAKMHLIQVVAANRTCCVGGWGNVKEEPFKTVKPPTMRRSQVLKEVKVQIYNAEECLAWDCYAQWGKRCRGEGFFTHYVSKNSEYLARMICSISLVKQNVVCKADSGSPLSCSWDPIRRPRRDARGVVVGLVSLGLPCGSSLTGSTIYVDLTEHYGLLNLFDARFIGGVNDPWARPASGDCSENWPHAEPCRRGFNSRSKRISGSLTLIVWSFTWNRPSSVNYRPMV